MLCPYIREIYSVSTIHVLAEDTKLKLGTDLHLCWTSTCDGLESHPWAVNNFHRLSTFMARRKFLYCIGSKIVPKVFLLISFIIFWYFFCFKEVKWLIINHLKIINVNFIYFWYWNRLFCISYQVTILCMAFFYILYKWKES